jgi:hypothetical protein
VSELFLDVRSDAYELSVDGEVIASLEGGASALLPDARDRLREFDIEAAIERSEDWLMPSSKRFQGLDLRVRDAEGRSRAALGNASSFTPEQVERAFDRAFDAVAHARPIDPASVADVVLLRELVHHGRLSRVVLQ